MTVQARKIQGLLPIGDAWILRVCVLDLNGCPVAQVPTFTVTKPDGTASTPTAETVTAGEYRAVYLLAAEGRHVARAATVDYGVTDWATYAAGPTTAAGMPTTSDLAVYLGGEESFSWTMDQLTDALAIESAAQRSKCDVPAVYPDDLRGALLRRAQRNLAMRVLPLALATGDADTGAVTVLPGRDPEVRRLEAPFPKLVFG